MQGSRTLHTHNHIQLMTVVALQSTSAEPPFILRAATDSQAQTAQNSVSTLLLGLKTSRERPTMLDRWRCSFVALALALTAPAALWLLRLLLDA